MDTLPNGPTLPPKFTILTNLNLRYSKLLSIERKLSCMVNWLLAEYFKSPTPPLLPRKCDFDKLESTLLVSKDASAKVFAFLTKWWVFLEKLWKIQTNFWYKWTWPIIFTNSNCIHQWCFVQVWLNSVKWFWGRSRKCIKKKFTDRQTPDNSDQNSSLELSTQLS